MGLSLAENLRGSYRAKEEAEEHAAREEEQLWGADSWYEMGLAEVRAEVKELERRALAAEKVRSEAEDQVNVLREELEAERKARRDDAAEAWFVMMGLGRSLARLGVSAPAPEHPESDLRASLDWVRAGAGKADEGANALMDFAGQTAWRGAFLSLHRVGCSHLPSAEAEFAALPDTAEQWASEVSSVRKTSRVFEKEF
jgi:hypothetical protein